MKKVYFFFVAGAAVLFLNCWSTNGQVSPAQIPLAPESIPKFVDPVPHFAGKRVDASGGNLVIRYLPALQRVISTGTELNSGTVGETPGVGLTRVWAYSVSNNGGASFTPPTWPSYTIEAKKGVPVNVTYENHLDGETYASVNLVPDQTIHWADPYNVMSTMPMDTYTGPVPVTTHLHGAEDQSASDGHPLSWYTPGYGIKGSAWQQGASEHYLYPNSQEETTLWFHDHTLGLTRLNVYAGLAGFYFIRGENEERDHLPGWSGDDLVREVTLNDGEVSGESDPYLPEIELCIQDRMFDTDGQLYFPNEPTNPETHPFWTPEFIGNVWTVNGKTWPYLSVAPRKYRFRLLNGSNSRFLEMWLQGNSKGRERLPIIQIGTDGGLLDNPVYIAGKLILAPGERADVIIDFTGAKGQSFILRNSANSPFPGGDPVDPETTGRVMKFVVNGKMVSKDNENESGSDKSRVPGNLRSNPIVKLTNFAGGVRVVATVKRQLTVNEIEGPGGPFGALINNTRWDGNGFGTPGLGESEQPVEGTSELWQIINLTEDAHPIHIHLVQFQLVSRQPIDADGYALAYAEAFGGTYQPEAGPPLPYNTPNADNAIGGNPAVSPYITGRLKPAEPNERGWKDTFTIYPGEATTFIIRFAPTKFPVLTPLSDLIYSFNPSQGPGYVWHCHILDHEDNEFMRPYTVSPSPVRALGSTLLPGFELTKVAGPAIVSGTSVNSNGIELDQNYPNPFSGSTSISFNLPQPDRARLLLLNQYGEVIKVLADSYFPAGTNTVNLSGENLTTGIYYYRLEAGLSSKTKMIVKN